MGMNRNLILPRYKKFACVLWDPREEREHQWELIEDFLAGQEQIQKITTAGTPRHERAVKDMYIENTRMVRMGLVGHRQSNFSRSAPKKGGPNGKRNSTSESSTDGTGEEVA